MRFRSLGQTQLDQLQLEESYALAQSGGRVKVGADCLFFPAFAAVEYLPYQDGRRIWLRQEEVTARLCCGRANFDQFFLMVEAADGRVHKGGLTDLTTGRQLLELLAQRAPHLPQGRADQVASD